MLTVGDIKNMNLPDDTPIEINSIWDEKEETLHATDCEGFFHEDDKKLYLTPHCISI